MYLIIFLSTCDTGKGHLLRIMYRIKKLKLFVNFFMPELSCYDFKFVLIICFFSIRILVFMKIIIDSSIDLKIYIKIKTTSKKWSVNRVFALL